MEFTATVTRITPVNVRDKVIDAGCAVKKGVLAKGIAGVTSMKNGPCITVSQDLSEEWQRVTIAAIVAEILDAGEMLHVIAEGSMDDPADHGAGPVTADAEGGFQGRLYRDAQCPAD